jgi:HEAT repeat protein
MRRHRLYAESAHGVLADLAAAGFPDLEKVGELRQRGVRYEAAVPVLLEWLPKVSYLMLSEDIVRTLSVSFAKKLAAPVFLRLFRDPPVLQDPLRPETSEPAEEYLRWIIGNGLGIFADPSLAGELIELAMDRRFGKARYQTVAALPKTKDERVPGVLLSLLDDPTVCAHAIAALGRMRVTAARPAIEAMLASSDKNVRDEAKKALKRIDG